MNYLLIGAEFNNKGAEAMTLVALKNIYDNDKNANVFLFSDWTRPSFKLKKELTYLNIPLWYVRKLCGRKNVRCYKQRIKDFIKFFIPGKKSAFGTYNKIKKMLKTIDITIDISGFAFSSKWGDEDTIDWISQIDLMEKLGSKVYLMPQSFGPFDYESNFVLEYGKRVLSKCELICAREQTGYNLLKELGLNNISLQADSVLSSNIFDIDILIENYNNNERMYIERENNIAIIPNARLIDRGGMDVNLLLKFYKYIIDNYVEQYDFYLFAHAGEDIALCNLIKENYKTDNRVKLIDYVLPSFVFEKFVANMNFIVASRFHAIVHAYKENVPAIVLGWADKYKGLVLDVDQQKYQIDLNYYDEAISAVNEMADNYKSESEIIKTRVIDIQKQNCYNFLKTIGIKRYGNK